MANCEPFLRPGQYQPPGLALGGWSMKLTRVARVRECRRCVGTSPESNKTYRCCALKPAPALLDRRGLESTRHATRVGRLLCLLAREQVKSRHTISRTQMANATNKQKTGEVRS